MEAPMAEIRGTNRGAFLNGRRDLLKIITAHAATVAPL